MKVEIDLKEILSDEYGDSETLSESVRRQVIEHLTGSLEKGIKRRIEDETIRIMNDVIRVEVERLAPSLITDLMDAEFIPVDSYGRRSPPTTFRNAVIEAINGQMVYKKATYDSDKTPFTKAVDSVVSEKLASFKTAYVKMIDAEFTRQALEHATSKLKERLGIKP